MFLPAIRFTRSSCVSARPEKHRKFLTAKLWNMTYLFMATGPFLALNIASVREAKVITTQLYAEGGAPVEPSFAAGNGFFISMIQETAKPMTPATTSGPYSTGCRRTFSAVV